MLAEFRLPTEDGNERMGPPQLFARTATMADVSAAFTISRWTLESGTMLPKEPDEIIDMFAREHSVLVFDANNEVVSHAAISYVYSDGKVEIGCVVTDQNKRKNGAGTRAIKEVIALANDRYPSNIKFALANSASAPLFIKLGARQMDTSELSAEVWGPCSTCPKLPPQTPSKPFMCCDVPYDLTYIR